MKRLFAALLAIAALPAMAGGPVHHVEHRYMAQGNGRIVVVGTDGKVEWEASCPTVAHDAAVLPNGNFLFPSGDDTVVEMTPEKKVVWQYTSKPVPPYDGRVEVHAFQRLSNGLTMIAETGNRRIIEVDHDGKIIHQTPITVDHPNSHRDTRRVRKLRNGHYLACHEGDGMVREYDRTGKVVWSYKVDLNGMPRTEGHTGHGTEVFNALRLPNGNTLIGGGNNNRVFEVTPAGQTVWSVEQDELPGVHFCWITGLQVLPNGNIVINNTHAMPDNPQIVEVTRDKHVVWAVKDYPLLGNDLCATQVLDVRGASLR